MQTSVNTTLRLLFARQAKGKRKLVLRRVESRTGAVALASRWLLGYFRRARLNPVWRNSVSCSRSSNRTGGFPASGSRKRHTMFRVTPSATSEHNLGWLDSIVNPHVLCCLLRPSLTEAPSLRRSYPASAGLRTSPPPHTARPVSRELPVDPDRDHRWGFPCCVWSPLHTCHRHYPAGPMKLVRSSVSIVGGLPCETVRSAPAITFSGPAQRLLMLWPARSRSR